MNNSEQSRNSTKSNTKTRNQYKLFVGGLPAETTSEDLKSFLSEKAEVFEVVLKLRTNKKKCLGHGVVTTSKEGAEKLLAVAQFEYGNRIVKLAPYREGSELTEFRKELTRRRIFIKNLPEDTNIDFISSHFISYGLIESCYLRGEPSTDLKIAVMIFKNKFSALRVYQDYRFGILNFQEILRRNLENSIYVGFRFSELRDLAHRDSVEGDRMSGVSGRSVLSHRIIEFFSKKPGTLGFDYTTGNSRNYVFRYCDLDRRNKCYLGNDLVSHPHHFEYPQQPRGFGYLASRSVRQQQQRRNW